MFKLTILVLAVLATTNCLQLHAEVKSYDFFAPKLG